MGSGGTPKSLPNDPQKQGNIWHRYEQLENATRSLSGVNQQLVDERAQHKWVSMLPLECTMTIKALALLDGKLSVSICL